MKISGVLLFPIFIVFFSSAFSQSNPENEKPAIDVKVIGGLDYSRLTHDNTFSFFGRYDKAALNLSGGFSILYLYHEKYNFEVGLHYSKSGAKTEEQVGTDETGEEKGKFWFVQELKFVEIPILFIYQISTKKIAPYIFVGPNLAFLIDGMEKLESDYGEKEWSTNVRNKLNSINISAELGIGVKYKVTDRFNIGISSFYLWPDESS